LTYVVLLVLAAVWAVVLVPPLLRARTRTGRSSDSIGDFNHHLGVLSRTNGTFGRRSGSRNTRPDRLGMPVLSAGVVPGRLPPIPARGLAPQRAAKRRRDITLGLAVAVIVTLAFALIAQRDAMWLLQGLVDVLFVSYIGLIAFFRSQQLDRARTVHYLPQPRAPELALRRTASS
jgi:hypothetical protein